MATKPQLTKEERENIARYVEAAWRSGSDRGYAEDWCVREIVKDLASIIERLTRKGKP